MVPVSSRFSVKSSLTDSILVLKLSGPFGYEEGRELRAYVGSVQLEDRVVLDLSGVERMSSSGLACLIDIQAYAASRGTGFRIEKPNPLVVDTIRMTRLERLFDIEPDSSENTPCSLI